MKKFFAFAIMTLLTTAAHAGSLNLDFRFDYLSEGFNDDATTAAGLTTAPGVNNSRFTVQTARLDYKGKLNEETWYRVRARFAAKDQGAMNKGDQTNTTLDYAYIANKTGDLTLTVGKFNSDIGGYEGTTSGPDLYFLSGAYGGSKYLGTGGTVFGVLNGFSNLIYVSGVKLGYTMGDNEIALSVADTNGAVGRSTTVDTLSVGGTPANTSMLTGLTYKGSFDNKAIGVMAGYFTENLAKDTSATYTNVGVQYKMNQWLAQFDYILNSTKYAVTTFTPEDKLTSMVLKVAYDINDLSDVQLKFATDEEALGANAAAAATNKFTSYGLAYEWKAKKDDNFRYHLAYTSRTAAIDSVVSTKAPAMTQLILGARIYADFLK